MNFKLIIKSITMGIIVFSSIGCTALHEVKNKPEAYILDDNSMTKIKYIDKRTNKDRKHFPKFGQCQIKIPMKSNEKGLYNSAKPVKLASDIKQCLSIAVDEKLDILILPELSLSMSSENREKLLSDMKKITLKEEMIIIAGSYYDENRYNRIAVVGPNWMELGYKIRPSRFEVSALADKGMKSGEEIKVFKTDYGNFAIITCVDLISDEIQYLMRDLSTKGKIDILMNINHNPAAWEFLIEANSIVRRHPIFVSITNVNATPKSDSKCIQKGNFKDNGYCYGHTAIFSSLRQNTRKSLLAEIPEPSISLSDNGNLTLELPYNNIAGDIGSFRDGMLIYELNMRMKRVPKVTNAPDQGYPPIKGLKVIKFESKI